MAAEDRDVAAEALALIDVEYEELPAVFDPLQALGEDAPILHPEVNSYIGLPRPLENPSNAFVRDTWSKGNPTRALPRPTSSSRIPLPYPDNIRRTWNPTPASYGSMIRDASRSGPPARCLIR